VRKCQSVVAAAWRLSEANHLSVDSRPPIGLHTDAVRTRWFFGLTPRIGRCGTQSRRMDSDDGGREKTEENQTEWNVYGTSSTQFPNRALGEGWCV